MAGYQTREFGKTITITYEQAKMIRNAQQDMYDSGIVSPNSNVLAGRLSGAAAILGLAFAASTSGGLAIGIVSLSTGLIPSEKDILKSMVYEGVYQFNSVIRLFENNPGYKMIEIELPYIEYKQSGSLIAQFITGKGRPIRINTGSGWIIL